MTVYAKIRAGFSATVGEITHEGGVIIAVTEAEFKAIAHKVEELSGDVARALHLTKGHALAVSPDVAKAQLGELPAEDADLAPTPTAEQEGAPKVELEAAIGPTAEASAGT